MNLIEKKLMEEPVWEGFGVSLAWWAKAYGDRTDLADALFTLKEEINITNYKNETFNVPGLGLNIVKFFFFFFSLNLN